MNILQFILDGHLGYFKFMVITTSAAMNIWGDVF